MTIVPLEDTKLFKPVTLSNGVTLQNRLVLPPMERLRSTKDYIPSDLQLDYYDQRSKRPGSLLITEATAASQESKPWDHIVGIWTEQQFAAWKLVVDRVHKNKSYISVQLWNLGNFYDRGMPAVSFTQDEEYVTRNGVLNSYTVEEIKDIVQKFSNAAENAINKAGFDFVEIHGAHGYIFDQFFQAVTNKRNDLYGGSIENRARFFLEVVDELIIRVGIEKVGFRLSPWATMGSMEGAQADPHPVVTYGYIIQEMQKRANESKAAGVGNGFAYLSIVEPRVNVEQDLKQEEVVGSNSFVKLIWDGIVIRAGGFEASRDALVEAVEDPNDKTLIAIGRAATSNPDLHDRLEKGLELTPYQR